MKSTPESRLSRTVHVVGLCINWLWSNLLLAAGLAVIALLVYSWVWWVDDAATTTMTSELQQRAFSDITVIHEPTMMQTKGFAPIQFDSYGTYSVKAGNCRFVVETPGGVPTIDIKSQTGTTPDITIHDADLTRLMHSSATRGCF